MDKTTLYEEVDRLLKRDPGDTTKLLKMELERNHFDFEDWLDIAGGALAREDPIPGLADVLKASFLEKLTRKEPGLANILLGRSLEGADYFYLAAFLLDAARNQEEG